MASFPDKHEFDALEAQLREVFGRVVYTQKTQEKMADLTQGRYNTFQWIQTALSGVTTTSLLYVVFGDKVIGSIIAGSLSTALFAVNLYLQNTDLGRRAERHTETAAILWGIRETYLTLITDLLSPDPNIEVIKEERTRLQDLTERVYKTAPRTIYRAYKAAQDGLKNNEEYTFSERELDFLLPEELRKSTRRNKTA